MIIVATSFSADGTRQGVLWAKIVQTETDGEAVIFKEIDRLVSTFDTEVTIQYDEDEYGDTITLLKYNRGLIELKWMNKD